MKTSIWLMRHAPTLWNKQKRIQGGIDTDILVQETSTYFHSIHAHHLPQPDLIVVSQLKRTLQTAQALSIYKKWSFTPIIREKGFNERSWGIFEGKTFTEVTKHLVKLKHLANETENLKEITAVLDHPEFRVKGSETLLEVKTRAHESLLTIAQQYTGKTILVITHAGVLISLNLPVSTISHLEFP